MPTWICMAAINFFCHTTVIGHATWSFTNPLVSYAHLNLTMRSGPYFVHITHYDFVHPVTCMIMWHYHNSSQGIIPIWPGLDSHHSWRYLAACYIHDNIPLVENFGLSFPFRQVTDHDKPHQVNQSIHIIGHLPLSQRTFIFSLLVLLSNCWCLQRL